MTGGMQVQFWGVRGSLATPGLATAHFGGNTSCVEIRADSQRFIFDMGSGLRELGNQLRGQSDITANVFLSHYHWDHILGLPFFGPAYMPTTQMNIYGCTREDKTVHDILAGQMINPYFPVSLSAMRAKMKFENISDGDTIHLGNVSIVAKELCHPGGALGFRITYQNTVIVYATDFEHGTTADQTLIDLSRDANLLIYDATYTPEEYPRYKGWGHSTWEKGAEIAQKAGVQKLILFHHDPSHDDAAVRALELAARAQMSSIDAAVEGAIYSF